MHVLANCSQFELDEKDTVTFKSNARHLCARTWTSTLAVTTLSTETYSSATDVTTLDRAFNLDILRETAQEGLDIVRNEDEVGAAG